MRDLGVLKQLQFMRDLGVLKQLQFMRDLRVLKQLQFMRDLGVLTTATVKTAIFWDVTPCGLIESH
jgi:hypothetical protein